MTTTVISLRGGPITEGSYVRIDRATKWGNPFVIGVHGNRSDVIEKYRTRLRAMPDLIAAARAELQGKTLACWCKPLACHGDVLAAVAEGAAP